MNRADQIRLSCVQALEKDLVQITGGWSRKKAAALLTAIQQRPRSNLPVSTQPNEVFEAIFDILVSLENAESKYIPKWAEQFLVR